MCAYSKPDSDSRWMGLLPILMVGFFMIGWMASYLCHVWSFNH